MAVLFEELKIIQPQELEKAEDSLIPLLDAEEPLYRGEAVSLLGIINSAKARRHIEKRKNDPSPQVREMVELILKENT